MIESMRHATNSPDLKGDSFPTNNSSNSFSRNLGCHEDTLGSPILVEA
jgi:hypothetical protein